MCETRTWHVAHSIMSFWLTFTASVWRNENLSPAVSLSNSAALFFFLIFSFYAAYNRSQTANVQHITNIHIHKVGHASHLFAIDRHLLLRDSQMYRDLFELLCGAQERKKSHLKGDIPGVKIAWDWVFVPTFLQLRISLQNSLGKECVLIEHAHVRRRALE